MLIIGCLMIQSMFLWGKYSTILSDRVRVMMGPCVVLEDCASWGCGRNANRKIGY